MFSLITFLAAVAFFGSVNALPATFDRRGGGVSSGQLSQFALLEQYAAAAYCKDNSDGVGSITCSSGCCPSVQSAAATSILEFENLGATDATGFVAVDDQNKLIVLSYRGSTSLGNWIGNFDIDFNAFAPCTGCQVHSGFLSSWTDSKNEVTSALTQAKAAHPDYSIIFTGHSLGAAIATLAAAELRQQGFNIALYTYGSPMVGNGQFASFVTAQGGGNFRITHAFDAVPKLPGYLGNYRHVSPEYWITAPSGSPVGTGDIKMSTGNLDLLGNQGTLISNIGDHLWYFNAISSCTGGFEL